MNSYLCTQKRIDFPVITLFTAVHCPWHQIASSEAQTDCYGQWYQMHLTDPTAVVGVCWLLSDKEHNFELLAMQILCYVQFCRLTVFSSRLFYFIFYPACLRSLLASKLCFHELCNSFNQCLEGLKYTPKYDDLAFSVSCRRLCNDLPSIIS